MSSWKNLIKQRTYRERAQPAARKQLGLLEKHKDYVLRARDFHKKEDAIKKLKEKAAFRNPDEYYFGMAHTKVQDGVHRKANAALPSHDELRHFKSSDASYLMVKQTAEAKKIAKLQASLHMLDAPLQNRHTYFAESEADGKLKGGADALFHRGDTPAEIAKQQQQQQLGDAEDGDAESLMPAAKRVQKMDKRAREKLERARAAKYSELEQRKERASKMGHKLERLGIEKALMGKGARKKLKQKKDVDGSVIEGPRQYKFKQRRKK